MRLFFSVGEPSGDLHGSNLIEQLQVSRSDCECVGFGGPLMEAAGCDLHEELTKFAVMGLGRAVRSVPRLWKIYRRADHYFANNQVDAVVLIDFPGFNWWIAKAAKRHGIPVFYYGVPQMWAWAPWRVRKMRRLVDHALCKLPFEVDWFAKRGCRASYVGHPYFDELKQQSLDQEFIEQHTDPERQLITMLPGSRDQEVEMHLPWFQEAAEQIAAQNDSAHFAIACYKEKHQTQAQEMADASSAPISVFHNRTPELIHMAHSCLACSGSVSLELMYHAKPTVIMYRVTRRMGLAIRLLKTVRYITLVNLFASSDPFGKGDTTETVPFPEYLGYRKPIAEVAGHFQQWLSEPDSHRHVVDQLEKLKSEYVQVGASVKAAEYILCQLSGQATKRAA